MRGNSVTTIAEREIVYDVKENLCYTASDSTQGSIDCEVQHEV